MRAYIEEGAWASCTYDLGNFPRQLVKESDRQVGGYASRNRLLTIDDRAINDKFTCQVPAKTWGGLAALIGGIAFFAAVASGPIGWATIAIVGNAAVWGGVGAIVFTTVVVKMHDCSDPLKNGEWVLSHSSVLIKGKPALLYSCSVLKCGAGGWLIASETQAAAQKLSDSMKGKARGELGVQILSNALLGGLVGLNPSLLGIGLAVGGYAITDIAPTNLSPVHSADVGIGLSALGFGIDAAKNTPDVGPSGTNFSKNFRNAGAGVLVGLASDMGEQFLANLNKDAVKHKVVEGSPLSGKTIVADKEPF